MGIEGLGKIPACQLEFVYGNLTELITTGETIDLIEISIGQQNSHLVNFDLQYDLSELIKMYNYDTSLLEPTTLEIQRQSSDGGIYGLPITTWATVLFYNKEIFDKFGHAYPEENMTWDELYDMARALTRVDEDIQLICLRIICFARTSFRCRMYNLERQSLRLLRRNLCE